MSGKRIVRRVTKKSYDQYNVTDYSLFSDNLNPINPTQLEAQYNDMVQAVQKRVIEAYEKAKIEPPQEIFSPDISPSTLLNDLDSLINKIKGNPLEDLYGKLGSLDAISAFISAGGNADDILGNPLKLDCSGVELTLKDAKGIDGAGRSNSNGSGDGSGNGSGNGSEDGSGNGNGSGGDASDGIESTSFKITYEGLEPGYPLDNFPPTLLVSECPYELPEPDCIGANGKTTFKGWFYDNGYSQKVPNRMLSYPGKDIVLYAYFTDEDDDADGGGVTVNDKTNLGNTDNERECDLIELAFLKIILIIIQVAKILIQVLILVLNIMKAAADIAKDAQLCWINPPSLQSLISYVMQRLSAIVFQIVGMILLKLWAMLNLDCISQNTMNTIAEINAALAGLNDLLGSIEPLAIAFNGAGSDLWKSLKEMIANMKEDLTKRCQEVWDDLSNVGAQMEAAGQELADTYTNPKTYLAMVPPEISDKVMAGIDGIESIKANIANLQQTITTLTNRNAEVVNTIPKGTEVVAFSN